MDIKLPSSKQAAIPFNQTGQGKFPETCGTGIGPLPENLQSERCSGQPDASMVSV